ncbi:uncharacterized protein LOC108676480 [Hyalella azteca]|uniref:Uncharacterized protein LOC108676480 n=1 Tax=Hyalella azteca TaxID=294128 RepID=A0A8B7P1S7_HYAAZ|nr:uncharacterized protein LOC108676480 [Hyalella azteca]
MAMLAEPRMKGRHIRAKREATLHTNKMLQTQLTIEDADYTTGLGMAKKLMENLGWKEGQGLGASNQGLPEPIKVHQNCESRGVGYSAKRGVEQEHHAAHYERFESVLAFLSAANRKKKQKDDRESKKRSLSVHDGSDESSENQSERHNTGSEPSDGETQTKPKRERNRLEYHKRTRAKDVSNYSRNDLDCVLGAKAHALYSNIVKENELETADKFPVSQLSTTDYFTGLQESKSSFAIDEEAEEDVDTSPVFAAQIDAENSMNNEEQKPDDVIQKCFEDRMASNYANSFVKSEDVPTSGIEESSVDTAASEDVKCKAKKKKKKKSKKCNDADLPCSTDILEHDKENLADETGSEVEPQVKKPKKKSRKKTEEPSFVAIVPEEDEKSNYSDRVLKSNSKKKLRKDGSSVERETKEVDESDAHETMKEKVVTTSIDVAVEPLTGEYSESGLKIAVASSKKKKSKVKYQAETSQVAEVEEAVIGKTPAAKSKKKSIKCLTKANLCTDSYSAVDTGTAQKDTGTTQKATIEAASPALSAIWKKYSHRYATAFVQGDILPGNVENKNDSDDVPDNNESQIASKPKKKRKKKEPFSVTPEKVVKDDVSNVNEMLSDEVLPVRNKIDKEKKHKTSKSKNKRKVGVSPSEHVDAENNVGDLPAVDKASVSTNLLSVEETVATVPVDDASSKGSQKKKDKKQKRLTRDEDAGVQENPSECEPIMKKRKKSRLDDAVITINPVDEAVREKGKKRMRENAVSADEVFEIKSKKKKRKDKASSC